MKLKVGDKVRVRLDWYYSHKSCDVNATILRRIDSEGHVYVEIDRSDISRLRGPDISHSTWYVMANINANKKDIQYDGYGKVLRKIGQ
jgi:hypothetical protein